MARYTGSKTKLSKKIGKNLFNKGARSYSAKDDFTKRPYKSGQHGPNKRFSRTSEYGKQLLEKQSLRYSYGLVEKQLANLFKKAFKTTGDTGKFVLISLERRLDNLIYKSGWSNSRDQARQLVNHGHFQVNGITVDIPSYQVKIGDIIIVKDNKKVKNFWKEFKLEVPNTVPSWIDASKSDQIKVINLPLDEDLPQEFKVGAVVEYYSRKVR
ncbi:MAG: 30S ribosomal protein S4 [candidate division SR1 bacterium]|nr:30S ribosomal protein S4 [candidate division SR1 bacterium]